MIEQLIGAGEVDFSSRPVASQRLTDAIRELQTVTETELEQKMELVKLMGLHPSAAVSYTHLDVYKRQEEARELYADRWLGFTPAALESMLKEAGFRNIHTDIDVYKRQE